MRESDHYTKKVVYGNGWDVHIHALALTWRSLGEIFLGRAGASLEAVGY